jgi:hypothetical protein
MPSWKELKRFCDRDQWDLYKDTDHFINLARDTRLIPVFRIKGNAGEIPLAPTFPVMQQAEIFVEIWLDFW